MAFNIDNQSQNIFSKLKAMAPAKRFGMLRDQQKLGAASPFTMLTPVEFAELFPKYYLKGMPDVKGFYDALAKKKAGGVVEGEATTSSGASVSSSEKVTNVVKAREIYDYIRSKGIDHVHAAGIVNNMKYESNFNSGAIGDGGTSGGLFQHHASRFSAMKQYVGEGWQTNWKKQIDFAMTEGDMKTYLSRNFANPSDASIGFTKDFERPANTETTAMYRSHTAGGYSDAMMGKAGEPSGGQTPGGNYEMNANGFVVPKDKSLYDSKNDEQCATLSKGINPDLGRTGGWTIVEGPIKPGVVVATTRYNLPGGDRMGAGYHTGVAMTAPDESGNFLLLEQFKGQKPRVRQVNKDEYSGGAMGGSVKFGLVQSNGRIHDEQSKEALQMGANLVDDEQKKRIMSNIEALDKGGTQGGAGTGTGSVEFKKDETSQNQTNFDQQQATRYASTAQISDVVKTHTGQIGEIMGFISMITGRGEGLGGEELGSASRPYESGARGVHTISSGKGDKGGVSYGEHQLSTKTGMMSAYLKSDEGKQFAHHFQGMRPGSRPFNEAYKRVAVSDPEAFAKSQHEYIKKTLYDPLEQHAKKLGFNTEHPAMKEALFSMGVQHGGAKRIVSKVKSAAGSAIEDQINALYAAREKYTKHKFSERYSQEKKDVLALAKPAPKIETAPPKESMTAKITKPFRDLLGPEPAQAKPITEGENTTQVFDRMRKLKSPTANVPVDKSSVDFAPSIMDENYIKKLEMSPAKPDRQSMSPVEKQQSPITMNPMENRPAHMQPTPSLARAMDNTRGIVSSNYTSLTNTKLG
jgi:hypothetical protein